MEPGLLVVVKVVVELQREEVVLQLEVVVVLVSVEVVEWQCAAGSPPWIQSAVEVQVGSLSVVDGGEKLCHGHEEVWKISVV